jgi:hypothetical protein
MYGGLDYQARAFLHDLWSSSDGMTWTQVGTAAWPNRGARVGAGMDAGTTDAYRRLPSPLPLPPLAGVLGAASTQPTTLPATKYTSTRLPKPQG